VPGKLVISEEHGRCLEAASGVAKAGTPVQMWDCHGYEWQKWSFMSDGTLRTLNMCLTVAGQSTEDGAELQIDTCRSSAAQRFNLNAAQDLIYLYADKCLDVVDHGDSNGTTVQIWSCSGQGNQKWKTG
jgi:hypothetical protein